MDQITTAADLAARHLGQTIRCNDYQDTLVGIRVSGDRRYPIALDLGGGTETWVEPTEPASVIGGEQS